MTNKALGINRSILTMKIRDTLRKDYRVESINTGRIWCFQEIKELESFFFGRNKKFYRVFKQLQLNKSL